MVFGEKVNRFEEAGGESLEGIVRESAFVFDALLEGGGKKILADEVGKVLEFANVRNGVEAGVGNVGKDRDPFAERLEVFVVEMEEK